MFLTVALLAASAAAGASLRPVFHRFNINGGKGLSALFEWIDDRWHLDGRPIHAGAFLEIRWPDGFWQSARIETANRGLVLYAHFEHHGEAFRRAVDLAEKNRRFRWPI